MSTLVALAAIGPVSSSLAQSPEVLRNVVQLSATGSVEVEQDWLQLTLATTREGRDAEEVQRQLKQVVDAALHSLKAQQQGLNLQVRSGSFGVYPRQGADGKIKAWQGRAEIVVEGKDFARISQAATQVPTMTVSALGFGLSKAGRQAVQAQAQAQAVESFKQRASGLAKQFGFETYTLREVSVNSQDGYHSPRLQRVNNMLAMATAKEQVEEALAVEPGKEEVSVTVVGSVQLQ